MKTFRTLRVVSFSFRPAIMAVAVIAALTGCAQEEVEVGLFENVAACAAAGYNRSQCEDSFAKAQALHAEVAPRFDGQVECEEEFGGGQCIAQPVEAATAGTATGGGGHSSFIYMPNMWGYGYSPSAYTGLNTSGQPLSAGSGFRAQPVYRHTSGNLLNAGGNYLGSGSGRTTVGASGFNSRPVRATASSFKATTRGGFGRGGSFGG